MNVVSGDGLRLNFDQAFLFDRSRSFYARPHRRELSIGNNSCHIEFNSIAFYPRAKVSPDFPDVTGLCDSDTTSTDRLADAVLQFKSCEFVSRGTRINVVSETRARVPSTFNSGETPNNQIVLQKGEKQYLL